LYVPVPVRVPPFILLSAPPAFPRAGVALLLYMPVSLLIGWPVSFWVHPLMSPAVPSASAAAADKTVSFFANMSLLLTMK
jgi:hypothetical protein